MRRDFKWVLTVIQIRFWVSLAVQEAEPPNTHSQAEPGNE
ncbi:Uncharacterized protein dnm_098000 [Desulfonema magnum]|uniref:Uncharacterized protein n=1 Tax=Desulfonema magnum TaxID=45655 RepID=A0A975BXL8_9BACT|nr:Uncharacterized protein dnm_097990 [Desulfonema magnum]QTA93696.1 Uncharacterized protein dnm_098000 [Desulfonema magnum]